MNTTELTPNAIRAEIKRLKACIREVDETRVAPFEDRLRELKVVDFPPQSLYLEVSRVAGDGGAHAASKSVASKLCAFH